MFQLFIRFLEFTEFTEFFIHLGKSNVWVTCEYAVDTNLVSFFMFVDTGRVWLIQSHSSARIPFKLSGTMPCNLNFSQNFELEISLN